MDTSSERKRNGRVLDEIKVSGEISKAATSRVNGEDSWK